MPHFCIPKNGSFWKWAPVHLCRPFLSGLRAGREAGSHLLQRGRGQGFTGLIQSPIQFLEGEPGETHLPHPSLEASLKEQGQKETLRRSLWGEDIVTCHLALIMASSCGTITNCVRVLSFSWDAELAANRNELRDWEKGI